MTTPSERTEIWANCGAKIFHVAGSRYFGTHGVASDWDYVAEDSPQLRAALEVNGFVNVWWCDPRSVSLRAVYQRGHVQIHLRKNVALHLRVMAIVKSLRLGWILKHKKIARRFWQSIYFVVRKTSWA